MPPVSRPGGERFTSFPPMKTNQTHRTHRPTRPTPAHPAPPPPQRPPRPQPGSEFLVFCLYPGMKPAETAPALDYPTAV